MKQLKWKPSLIYITYVIAFFYAGSVFGQAKNTKHDLGPMKFTATGDLDIQASATSSQNDFDFLVGKWNLKDKKLKSRLTNNNEAPPATHIMCNVSYII